MPAAADTTLSKGDPDVPAVLRSGISLTARLACRV